MNRSLAVTRHESDLPADLVSEDFTSPGPAQFVSSGARHGTPSRRWVQDEKAAVASRSLSSTGRERHRTVPGKRR